MPRLRHTLSLLCCLPWFLTQAAFALPPLQLFVDLTPMGKTLRPPPGVYAGPVVITKPIILDGGGEVTIDGEGEGTILTVKADNTVIRGLHLTRSGEGYDAMDAGLLIEADKVAICAARVAGNRR